MNYYPYDKIKADLTDYERRVLQLSAIQGKTIEEMAEHHCVIFNRRMEAAGWTDTVKCRDYTPFGAIIFWKWACPPRMRFNFLDDVSLRYHGYRQNTILCEARRSAFDYHAANPAAIHAKDGIVTHHKFD